MAFKLSPTGMGGELSSSSMTYVAPDQEIRCLHDHVIVEPLGVLHSAILTVIEHTKPLRGVVKAVGKGHYPLRYDNDEKGRRTKAWRSKVFQPTEVQVGDVVELGAVKVDGRMIGYSFQEFMWGSKPHLICREADISGVVIDE